MRWVKRLSLGTLALMLVVLALASLILHTTWGARLVLSRASGLAPGELRANVEGGTLAGPLELTGVDYRLNGLDIGVQRLRVDVGLLQLATGRLVLDGLDASGVRVALPASGKSKEPPSGPVELPELALPMAISVKDARIRDARIVPAGGAPIVVRELTLGGSLMHGAVTVRRLSLDAPLGSVELGGRVDTSDNYRARLDARLGWRRGERMLSGDLTARGDLEKLELHLALDDPAAATLDATVTGLPGRPGYRFQLASDGVAPEVLGLDGMPGPVRGNLNGSGGPDELELSGWLAAGDQRVSIEALSASRTPDALVLDRLVLHGDRAADLTASGRWPLGGDAAAELDAHWSDLRVPLPGGRWLTSGSGRVKVDGVPDDYRLQAEADVGGAAPAGHWQVTGAGSLSAFAVDTLTAKTLGGLIQGQGRITWRPGIEWRGQVDARGVNPAALAAAWPGSLSASLDSSGRVAGGVPSGELRVADLRGTLRQRRVSGHADLEFDGLEQVRGELDAHSGDSHVNASGRYGPDTDARLDLDVASLGDWYPGAAGSVKGQVRLTGAPGALRADGSFQGSQLVLEDASVDSLSTSFGAGLEPAAEGSVHLEAGGVTAGPVSLDTVTVDLKGGLADHRLSARASGPTQGVSLEAAGGWREGRWTGRLGALRVQGEALGDWTLEQPVSLEAGPGAAELSSLCLASERGRLCGQGQWAGGGPLKVDADLEGLPLVATQPLLRLAADWPVEITGSLDAHLQLTAAPGEAPAIQGQWSAKGAVLSLPGREGRTRLGLDPFRGRVTLEGSRLEADAAMGVDRAGRLDAKLDSTDFRPADWPSAPVDGRLQVDLNDLTPLAPLLPGLAEPEGALHGELRLGGRLGAIETGGDLTLSGFGAELPAAGVTVSDGRLHVAASGSRLKFDGAVTSGGSLTLTGEAGMADDGTPSLKATVKGENFRAVDRPGLEASVSPDLELDLTGRRLDVNGSVKVPKAAVNVDELQGGGVSPSPDVVVVGREEPGTESAFKLFAEVDVTLGDDISLKAKGFEGSASGGIHVSDQPGRPTLASGELGVTGSYQAYGQSLTIRSGRLLFSDTPVDNPALDITAVRTVRDVTAGVRINGTARNPQATLFSEPSLGSEAETLSYLVLGRPLEQASSGEGASLSSAALALGLKGGDRLAGQIGSRFGISEVGVGQSSELGQSALTLGKYLSPRLYLSYGVGFVDQTSVVRLRYELTDHWALEAASGKETSGAITFYYER